MRRPTRDFLAIVASLAAPLAAIGAAQAQEPLFLRIRPAGEVETAPGGAGSSAEETARAARARSEAIWARADQRARIAIASVCTGCLTTPLPSAPLISVPPPPETGRPLTAVSAVIPDSALAQTGAP